jgi:hypothetical protein
MVGNAGGSLSRGASITSTRGSRAAYQPTRATARSLRSAALHSAPCSVATGWAGSGACRATWEGWDCPAWRGNAATASG